MQVCKIIICFLDGKVEFNFAYMIGLPEEISLESSTLCSLFKFIVHEHKNFADLNFVALFSLKLQTARLLSEHFYVYNFFEALSCTSKSSFSWFSKLQYDHIWHLLHKCVAFGSKILLLKMSRLTLCNFFYVHRLLPQTICTSQKKYRCFGAHIEASFNTNPLKNYKSFRSSPWWSETQSLVSNQSLNKQLFSVGSLATSTSQDVSDTTRIGDDKIGVLLLNLGGPETLEDVQPFLFNLFADPVIHLVLHTLHLSCHFLSFSSFRLRVT